MTEREQAHKRRLAAVLVVTGLLALVAAAWIIDALGSEAAPDYRVEVTRDGQVLRSFSLDDLRAMESHIISQYGLSEEGPRVLDVLADAGVDGFTQLTVMGLGMRDDGVLVLDAAEVTPDVILDFAQTRSTVKIAGPEIERAERVRDVTELRVD